MYVGITRARQEVELYYMTGTRENPRLKSRFIQEMGIEAYQEECGLE